jgi:hypothetical protein
VSASGSYPESEYIEMVWDELDRRVKEKQPTSAEYLYLFICLTILWLIHDSICYVIVLMSKLLFYNVENSKKKEKEKPLKE